MNERPYVSIVIPSYRNADIVRQNLPVLQRHLQERNISHEIILVDDGSNDGGKTRAVAAALGCRFEENPINAGKGAAVRRGMLAATGEFRLFTDADIPFETDAIDIFLRYLDFKEFHMAVGDRTLPESDYFDGIKRSRMLGSRIFSFIVGRFIVTGMFDTQCGLKGFRREIAEDIFGVAQINRFAFDVEIIYIALKRNYDIKRLPVRLRSTDGNSVSLLRHAGNMLYDIFRIKFFHVRGVYRKR